MKRLLPLVLVVFFALFTTTLEEPIKEAQAADLLLSASIKKIQKTAEQGDAYNGPQKLDRVLRCTHPVKRRGAKDGRE